ncbi:hypothetical protein [Hymenobacter sediminicola]|uniref:PorT family protein n=1 Tax=Hymenobacter sediminicola TaxID=2761579 RepID=A0A7G7W7Z8_9BACT|nr:hypothetical protein [Hymenobacter sediminicola]QNH62491.1 hypothetical protein H4317_01295 [Hymenobacter sediminicola]
MRRFLCLGVLSLLPLLTTAQQSVFQPGYIVRRTAPTDTVRGYVDVLRATRLLGQVRFRATPNASTETLRAAQLSAAGTTDGRQAFRTRMITGDSLRILEVISSGPLSLYTGYSPLPAVDFMLEQAGGNVLPLARTQFEPMLQNVVAQCPSLVVADRSKQRLLYARVPLAKVVNQYNDCQPTTVPKRYYPGVGQPVAIGIRAGLQRSQLWYLDNNHDFGFRRPASNTNLTAAIQLVLPIGGSLRAVVEGIYTKAHSYVVVRDQPTAAVNYFVRSADLKAELLQLPLMLRWQVGRNERRVHPYIEGGGGISYLLSSRAWYQAIPEATYDKPSAYDLGMDKWHVLVRGGGGITYRTAIGLLDLGIHMQSMNIGSPTERTQYKLQQSDLSLTYSRFL